MAVLLPDLLGCISPELLLVRRHRMLEWRGAADYDMAGGVAAASIRATRPAIWCCVPTHKSAAFPGHWCRERGGYRAWTNDQVTVGNFERITPTICIYSSAYAGGFRRGEQPAMAAGRPAVVSP